ncbi:hypothetical protein [Mycolicibacterium doricum]|uniref:hypothetical protein n=1 Tax=Mycolicibacterium doricum TaxID=126673 RepID=UPI00105654C6|nr:hypothetical protein [Mycolicibacterium doricum]MCV7269212.1 hypothetical protein [Mycolicibacterium doricum]
MATAGGAASSSRMRLIVSARSSASWWTRSIRFAAVPRLSAAASWSLAVATIADLAACAPRPSQVDTVISER